MSKQQEYVYISEVSLVRMLMALPINTAWDVTALRELEYVYDVILYHFKVNEEYSSRSYITGNKAHVVTSSNYMCTDMLRKRLLLTQENSKKIVKIGW